MTGDEHYRHAENLLGIVADALPGSATESLELVVHRAEVHALLALTAARGLTP